MLDLVGNHEDRFSGFAAHESFFFFSFSGTGHQILSFTQIVPRELI